MAQIKKWSFTLCALLFTSLSFTPLAHATGHAKTPTAQKSLPVKGSERKKKNTVSKSNTKKKTATTVTKKKTTSVVAKKAAPTSRKTAATKTTKTRAVKTANVVTTHHDCAGTQGSCPESAENRDEQTDGSVG